MDRKSLYRGLGLLGAVFAGAVFIPWKGFHPGQNAQTQRFILSQADSKIQDSQDSRQTRSTISGKVLSADQNKLTPEELQAFIVELENTFSFLAVAGVNEEQINKNLSLLNERKEAGARALIQILSVAPSHETKVRERISMVDYLVYRARWDENTREEILNLATSPIPDSVSPKLKGVLVVERAEILGRLAALDWESTQMALKGLEHPILRRLAASEAVFALAEQGMTMDEARSKIKEVIPDYIIASKSHVKN